MKKASAILLLNIAFWGFFAPGAQALMVNSQNQFFTAEHEDVQVTFVSASAAYTDLLYLSNPNIQFLFHNHATAPGTTLDLGTFDANTELGFELAVSTTGKNFFTNNALNADQLAHVKVTDLGGGTWQIGWEDIYNGGDHDFNDLVVNVQGSIVPEPSVMILVGLGLAGVGSTFRRRNRGLTQAA